jgi:hypothetical protein
MAFGSRREVFGCTVGMDLEIAESFPLRTVYEWAIWGLPLNFISELADFVLR